MTSFGPTLALCAWLGWGLATSPLPSAALAVMLLNRNPLRASLAFTGGWFVCQLGAFILIAPFIAALLNIKFDATQRAIVGWSALVLGAITFALAIVVWWRDRTAEHSAQAQKARQMLERAEHATPREAFVLACIFAVVNVTNVPYWAGIGLFLHRSDLAGGQKALVLLITALVASSTFLVATGLVFAFPNRVKPWLAKARTFAVKHSGSLLPGLLLIVGLTLLAVGARDIGLWS